MAYLNCSGLFSLGCPFRFSPSFALALPVVFVKAGEGGQFSAFFSKVYLNCSVLFSLPAAPSVPIPMCHSYKAFPPFSPTVPLFSLRNQSCPTYDPVPLFSFFRFATPSEGGIVIDNRYKSRRKPFRLFHPCCRGVRRAGVLRGLCSRAGGGLWWLRKGKGMETRAEFTMGTELGLSWRPWDMEESRW